MAGACALTAADGRETALWDSAAPGPGMRARQNGRKTWIVNRRSGGSVIRRIIGALDTLTVEYARHAARAMFADAGAEGADVPAGVPRRLRRTLEARDARRARGRRAPAHPARAR